MGVRRALFAAALDCFVWVVFFAWFIWVAERGDRSDNATGMRRVDPRMRGLDSAILLLLVGAALL